MKPGVEKEELKDQADLYEEWAMELLECSKEDAPTMLLGRRCFSTEEGTKMTPLWPDSVLEAAIGHGRVSCDRFIDHRQCKTLIDNIYNGCIYQLQPEDILLERLPDSALKVWYDEGSQLDAKTEILDLTYCARVELNDDDDDDNGFRLFRSPTETMWTMPFGVPTPLLRCFGVRSKMGTVFVPRLGKDRRWNVRNLMMILRHVFSVPRVRIFVHTLANVGFLVMLLVALCGLPLTESDHSEFSEWMWQSGILHNANAIRREEYLLWCWTITRISAEFMQLFRSGLSAYFSNGKQLVDVSSLFAILTCAALRLSVSWGWIQPPEAEHDFDATLLCQAIYGIVSIIIFFRSADVLQVNEGTGLLYVMFFEMWDEVLRWTALFVYLSLGFAVAFTVLMPGQGTSNDPPFLRPFWALLGDFSREPLWAYFPESGRTGVQHGRSLVGGLAELLLWVYVFIVTVVLVNMLIAQMATQYRRTEERSSRIAQTRFVQLIGEYHAADSLPPPLNVLLLPAHLWEMYNWLRESSQLEEGQLSRREKEQLEKRESRQFEVFMPQEVASYDTSSSRKALKALIKKETKKEKDSTAARLERLETSALEIEQAVEQQTELLLTRHAFEDYKRTFECYMKQIQPGLQRPPSPAVVGRRLSEAPAYNGQPPPRAAATLSVAPPPPRLRSLPPMTTVPRPGLVRAPPPLLAASCAGQGPPSRASLPAPPLALESLPRSAGAIARAPPAPLPGGRPFLPGGV